ncbi:MAG: DUF4126 domain-containing protein [Chloroflexi bacterium]|nr:DUF4126 domain-containing protein [Chloroflexota bacterium]
MPIDLFSAFGLSASAGLNAYIPLLIIALTARFTDLITLQAPYDRITSGWAIGAVCVLLVVEVLADKVPLADHVNDAIATFIRPVAGALLFAAAAGNVQAMNPVLALVMGLFTAGGVHAAKATARPLITATTGGLGNPVVSTLEDLAALVTSIVAILAPLLIAVAMLVFALLLAWWWGRRRHLAASRA